MPRRLLDCEARRLRCDGERQQQLIGEMAIDCSATCMMTQQCPSRHHPLAAKAAELLAFSNGSGFGDNFVQKLDQFRRDPVLLSRVRTWNTDHFSPPFPSSRSTRTRRTGLPAKVPAVLVTWYPSAINLPLPVAVRRQTRHVSLMDRLATWRTDLYQVLLPWCRAALDPFQSGFESQPTVRLGRPTRSKPTAASMLTSQPLMSVLSSATHWPLRAGGIFMR